MSKLVVDSSAWVEYFDGSEAGKKVKDLIEDNKNEIYTNLLTIAELSGFYHKKGIDFDPIKQVLISLSTIYSIDLALSEDAGSLYAQLRKERKSISFGDIFVLLTAKKLRGKLLTKDDDFRGLPEAIIIR